MDMYSRFTICWAIKYQFVEKSKRNVERRVGPKEACTIWSGGRVGQQRGRSCFLRAGEKRSLHT